MNNFYCRLISYRAAVIVGLSILSAIALSQPVRPQRERRLFYNPSESAPKGWYWLIRSAHLSLGSYVLARLPAQAEGVAATRGYLPHGIPILKRIGALAGKVVCEKDGAVRIEGQLVLRALKRDHQGRALWAWSGCRSLARGEYFLLSGHSPDSFDSRYFGPIPVDAVVGQAIPLWTW